MNSTFFEEKTFEKLDNRNNLLVKGEYELCTFINCDFSNSDLSGNKFSECEFISCNLSMANIQKSVFRDVKFKDSKLMGVHFETCNEFGLSFSFENCNLSHSSFYGRKLKGTSFKNSVLIEADFAGTDFSNSVFDNCDLRDANFEKTILEKADLKTAFNYSIDPEANRIKKAKFSLSGIPGLLDKFQIEIDRSN